MADASRTLFRGGSLVSMATVGQDYMLGFGYLLREHDELREKYEALEQGNVEAEKELAIL